MGVTGMSEKPPSGYLFRGYYYLIRWPISNSLEKWKNYRVGGPSKMRSGYRLWKDKSDVAFLTTISLLMTALISGRAPSARWFWISQSTESQTSLSSMFTPLNVCALQSTLITKAVSLKKRTIKTTLLQPSCHVFGLVCFPCWLRLLPMFISHVDFALNPPQLTLYGQRKQVRVLHTC